MGTEWEEIQKLKERVKELEEKSTASNKLLEIILNHKLVLISKILLDYLNDRQVIVEKGILER